MKKGLSIMLLLFFINSCSSKKQKVYKDLSIIDSLNKGEYSIIEKDTIIKIDTTSY